MTVLQIEHKVPSYDGWKTAFDSDPIGREKSGVKSYRIYRPENDRNYVIVDLVFETVTAASASLVSLRKLWGQVEGTVMTGPQARILEVVETKEY